MISAGLAVVLALFAAAPVDEVDRDKRPLIVALGDSLTSGHGIGTRRAYPAILEQRLEVVGLPFEVVNAGVSGDTSTRALMRLDRALRGNVRILILALGANDGLRGMPVAQFKTNLARIIEAARARGIVVLLCGMEALPIFGWDYSVAFHKVFRDLSAQYHLPLVPFLLRNVIDNADMMQPDQVHPNAEGARRIADNIWPYLKPLAEGIAAAQTHR